TPTPPPPPPRPHPYPPNPPLQPLPRQLKPGVATEPLPMKPVETLVEVPLNRLPELPNECHWPSLIAGRTFDARFPFIPNLRPAPHPPFERLPPPYRLAAPARPAPRP